MPPEPAAARVARPGALRLPWQLVGAALPLALAVALVLAWIAYRTADAAVTGAVRHHLEAVRAAAEAGAAAELARLEEEVRHLARDARTGAALAALADATRATDDEAWVRTADLAALRAGLAARLEALTPSAHAPRPEAVVDALPSARRALWLQAQFLLPAAVPAAGAYAAAHAAWHPLLAAQAAHGGFANLMLVRASDGLVVYDVGKTPLFQTSLLDGPYADTPLGALVRRVRAGSSAGAVQLADFAPFMPAGGAPQAFLAAPLAAEGAPDGVLVAAFDGATLAPAMSAGGRWTALGLGARGEVLLIGADGMLRGAPRGGAPAAAPPALRHASAHGEGVIAYHADDRTPMLAAVGAPAFGALGWRAAATVDASAARGASAGLATRLTLAAVALAALLGAALAGVAWWLAVPLRHLGTAVARLRPGDRQAHVPALGRGDAAALATCFNGLLARLRDEADAERRRRAAEAAALAGVVEAWRGGDLAPRAYASAELGGVATALNGLADRLATPAPPAVPERAAAVHAAAAHLRVEAARQLDALGAAAAATQAGQQRAARLVELARAVRDGSGAARAAVHAGESAVAALAAAAAPAPASRAALADGADATALLGDQLAVLAVNAALLAARDGDAAGGLAGEARDAAARAEALGAQLRELWTALQHAPADADRAARSAAVRDELGRVARGLGQCTNGVDALLAEAGVDDGAREAVQAAHAAARRVCQAAEVLAREAAADGARRGAADGA